MNGKLIAQTVISFCKAHEPQILTGASIAGFTSAMLMTAKAAPDIKLKNELLEKEKKRKPKFKEKVKANWKTLLPIGIVYATSVYGSVSSCSISMKRNALLATTLAATEVTLGQYKDKTVALLGEKAAKEVTEAVISEKVDAPKDQSVKIVPVEEVQAKGKMPCWEATTNQKFYATMEDIRKVQNDINESILQGFCGYKTLNDYYTELGLDTTSLGDEAWWDTNNLCKIDIEPIIKEGEYALYVNPKNVLH